MSMYEIVVKATHEVFEHATKFMQKIGHDDVEEIFAEITIGTLEFEEQPSDDDLNKLRKALLNQKEMLEKLVGMKVLDIKLRRVK